MKSAIIYADKPPCSYLVAMEGEQEDEDLKWWDIDEANDDEEGGTARL